MPEPITLMALGVAAIAAISARRGSPHKSSIIKVKGHDSMAGLPLGFEPISRAEVVARAYAQRGLGHYRMGGGAHFLAPDCFDPLGNNHPGCCDCTGLLAFCAKYRRSQYNTDGIVNDAKGLRHRFHIVPRDEPVLPGDFLVTDKGPDTQDHAGLIVDVLPGFIRLSPGWWTQLKVAQSAGVSWETSHHEDVEDHHGAVRITNAYRWRNAGDIIRANHII